MTAYDERLIAAMAEESHHRSARIRAGMQRRERDRLPVATAALDAAREQGYGPDTPPGDRGAVIFRLQQEGCLLEEIAQLFGICRDHAGRQVSDYRRSQGVPRGTPTRRAVL